MLPVFDDRGVSASIGIDGALYDEDAALAAAYMLTDRCHVAVDREGSVLTVTIRLKDGSGGEALKTACGDFGNALIDAALRARISDQTADIREALLKRAFGELAPRPGAA